MQITPIPFQDMAKHLSIDAGAVNEYSSLLLSPHEVLKKYSHALGMFECLPRPILHSVISQLDAKTAANLKITCAALRALVRENPHHELQYTLRFLEAASRPFAWLVHTKMPGVLARRGDISAAMQLAIPFRSNPALFDKIYSSIISRQALQNDFSGVFSSLKAFTSPKTRREACVKFAIKFAKRGNFAKSLEKAYFLYPLSLKHILYVCNKVIRFQCARGDETRAFETVAAIERSLDTTYLRTLHIALVREQARNGNREGAQRTAKSLKTQKDRDEAYNAIKVMDGKNYCRDYLLKNLATTSERYESGGIYQELALKSLKEGDLKKAYTLAPSIHNDNMRDFTYRKIVKAHIKRKELESAIAVADTLMQTDEMKYKAYRLIGVAKAKQGDFKGALEMLSKINYDHTRVMAYQRVITALLDIVPHSTSP